MKNIIILLTFIFAYINIIYAKEECNIEIFANNQNTNKDINLKCYKEGEYCEKIMYICSQPMNAINSKKEMSPIPLVPPFYFNVTLCKINTYYVNYENLKEQLNKKINCNENMMPSKSCYQKCMDGEFGKLQGPTGYINPNDASCCFKCQHSSYCKQYSFGDN